MGNIGATYAFSPFLFDFGVKYNFDNEFSYYTSATNKGTVEFLDYLFFIRAKWYMDTTLGGRKDPNRFSDLPNGWHPYIGIGPSSTWLTNQSPYVSDNKPHLDINNASTMLPEFSAGVHWKHQRKKGYRTVFNVSYRPLKLQTEGYGTKHIYQNDSWAFEVFQSFWDYHGFVPFVGLSYAMNELVFTETTANSGIQIKTVRSNDIGLVFGWDILPKHQSPWFLRTTLRYYPEIALDTNNGAVQFPNFEFNFIQFVYQF